MQRTNNDLLLNNQKSNKSKYAKLLIQLYREFDRRIVKTQKLADNEVVRTIDTSQAEDSNQPPQLTSKIENISTIDQVESFLKIKKATNPSLDPIAQYIKLVSDDYTSVEERDMSSKNVETLYQEYIHSRYSDKYPGLRPCILQGVDYEGISEMEMKRKRPGLLNEKYDGWFASKNSNCDQVGYVSLREMGIKPPPSEKEPLNFSWAGRIKFPGLRERH